MKAEEAYYNISHVVFPKVMSNDFFVFRVGTKVYTLAFEFYLMWPLLFFWHSFLLLFSINIPSFIPVFCCFSNILSIFLLP